MSEYIFKLPDLGEGTVESEIGEWFIKLGEVVEEETIVGTMMTDKAAVELSSPVTGKVIKLGGPESLSWTDMLTRIAAACDKKKLIIPMPIGVMKIAASLLDWLPFFPVTRDQLTMLEEGNTVANDRLSELIGRPPAAFTSENLAYLKS